RSFVACSAVVALVRGARVLDAARVGAGAVAEALDGLSPGKLHAADLAADALHGALGAAVAAVGALPDEPARTLVAMSGGGGRAGGRRAGDARTPAVAQERGGGLCVARPARAAVARGAGSRHAGAVARYR